MVRLFYLENEKKELFDLNNLKEYCFLTDPKNLGLSFQNDLELLGNTFIIKNSEIIASSFDAVLNFASYDNYNKFVNFVMESESLKLKYVVPFKNHKKTYYRECRIKILTKSEKNKTKLLSENIVLDFVGLWYLDNTNIFDMAHDEDEMRWDFIWDSRTIDYGAKVIHYTNKGHTPAMFKIELNDSLIELTITIKNSKEEDILTLDFSELDINTGDKFMYSNLDNDLYIQLIKADEEIINLFNEENIDITKNIFPKLERDTYEISINVKNEVTSGYVSIYEFYYGV